MSDDNHPDNTKLEHEGWQDIKDKKRGCTDCLLLVNSVLLSFVVLIVYKLDLITGCMVSNDINRFCSLWCN